MRVEFIGKFGSRMYVDETRAEEYKAAGYKPAASSVKDKETTEEVKAKTSRKKKEV